MQKYYLLALVIFTVAIPLRHASQESLAVAARKTFWEYFFFLALWGFGIKHIYWKLPP